jgi:hypothetical protein
VGESLSFVEDLLAPFGPFAYFFNFATKNPSIL